MSETKSTGEMFAEWFRQAHSDPEPPPERTTTPTPTPTDPLARLLGITEHEENDR